MMVCASGLIGSSLQQFFYQQEPAGCRRAHFAHELWVFDVQPLKSTIPVNANGNSVGSSTTHPIIQMCSKALTIQGTGRGVPSETL